MEKVRKNSFNKKIPAKIETSINEEEFRKRLFNRNKSSINSNSIKNDSMELKEKRKENEDSLNSKNSSKLAEKEIKDFNKQIFNLNTEEDIDFNRQKNININESLNIDDQKPLKKYFNKSIQSLGQEKFEIDEKTKFYNSLDHKLNETHNEKINDNLNFDEKNDRLFTNNNHLETLGVYESLETIRSKQISNKNISTKNKKFSFGNNDNKNNKYQSEDINYINLNTQQNQSDYTNEIINKVIKIPRKNLKFEKSVNFRDLTKEEKDEQNLRVSKMLEALYNLIEDSKFDPILSTFRKNEILQEFFMQRILELIAEVLDSEKENYIQQLLSEREEFKKNFQATEKEQREVKLKIN